MTDDSEPAGDDDIAGLSRSDPLAAVSPLDGRYAARTAPLSPYASEAALMRARTRVEVEYLIELAALDATPIARWTRKPRRRFARSTRSSPPRTPA